MAILDDLIRDASECPVIPDQAQALILRRFVARQTRFHSPVTFAKPRRLKLSEANHAFDPSEHWLDNNFPTTVSDFAFALF
jgi:hypothetical protein